MLAEFAKHVLEKDGKVFDTKTHRIRYVSKSLSAAVFVVNVFKQVSCTHHKSRNASCDIGI